MSRKEQKAETRNRILDATRRLMEDNQGQGISMGAIAKEVGISRQALYLHFPTRVELISATVHYVDEINQLDARFQRMETAKSGIELLEILIEVWGNYIPEIFGLARAMLKTRDSDEAMAAAWNDCMGCLRDVCRDVVKVLDKEGHLASRWTKPKATDVVVTFLSFHNWEQFTQECGWSTKLFVKEMKRILKQVLLEE